MALINKGNRFNEKVELNIKIKDKQEHQKLVIESLK